MVIDLRVIRKNNQVKYKYQKEKWPEGVKLSVLLYIITIFTFVLSVIISIISKKQSEGLISGIALTSIICCLGSMSFSISEIYFYKSYKRVTRNMLLLQILYLLFWIFGV